MGFNKSTIEFSIQLHNEQNISMQRHLANNYGIRDLQKTAFRLHKKTHPKKPSLSKPLKSKKKKKQTGIPLQTFKIQKQPKQPDNDLVFLKNYCLIDLSQNNRRLYSTHLRIRPALSTDRPSFTRKASYLRRKTTLSTQFRRQKNNEEYCCISTPTSMRNLNSQLRRRSTKNSITNQKTLEYNRMSIKPTENSFSTRPASITERRFRFPKQMGTSTLQYFKYQSSGSVKAIDPIHSQKIDPSPKKVMISDVAQKQILEQPQSNLYSASNTSSAKNSFCSSKSKLRTVMLLPLQSKHKNASFFKLQKGCPSSVNLELQGYLFVEAALQRINILAQYSQEIIQKYEDISDWDELVFLVYKKFYLERKKIVRSLLYGETKYFSDFLKTSRDKRKLQYFIRNYQCQKLVEDLVFENLNIEQSLRNLYNLIIQKSGDYINLHELDNFTMQIFKLLLEEISILKQIYEMDKLEVTNRLKNILKCAQALACLDKLQFRIRLNKVLEEVKSIKLVTSGSLFDRVQKFFRDQIYN